MSTYPLSGTGLDTGNTKLSENRHVSCLERVCSPVKDFNFSQEHSRNVELQLDICYEREVCSTTRACTGGRVRESLPVVVTLQLGSARQTSGKNCSLQSCHARALRWEGEWGAEVAQTESWRGENKSMV